MPKVEVSFGASPAARRQTLAVFFFVILIPLCLVSWALTVLLLLNPITVVPMVAYLVWMYFLDKSPTTGRRVPSIRKLSAWKYFADYFPIKLIKTAELDPEKSYVFAYHPHGIISMGAFGSFATDGAGFSKLFPGIDIHLLTLPINFRTPFMREFLLELGVCSSSAKSCQNILSRGSGSAICLVVGGAQEALMAQPHTNTVLLKSRKGFIREAMKAGASLVPVYAFGENDLYNTHAFPDGSFMKSFQEFAKRRFSFSLPLFHGRGIFLKNLPLLMPFRTKLRVVVGKPIPCDKLDPALDLKSEEAQKLIAAKHAEYMAALNDLFEKYREDEETRQRAPSLHVS